MDPQELQNELTKDVVASATLLGISVVQSIAAQTLLTKPELSLKDFTQVLATYIQEIRSGEKTITDL